MPLVLFVSNFFFLTTWGAKGKQKPTVYLTPLYPVQKFLWFFFSTTSSLLLELTSKIQVSNGDTSYLPISICRMIHFLAFATCPVGEIVTFFFFCSFTFFLWLNIWHQKHNKFYLNHSQWYMNRECGQVQKNDDYMQKFEASSVDTLYKIKLSNCKIKKLLSFDNS